MRSTKATHSSMAPGRKDRDAFITFAYSIETMNRTFSTHSISIYVYLISTFIFIVAN